jgi:hypothetical protein
MHRLSPRAVVESAEAILGLVVVTVIAIEIASETVEIVMEVGLGMRGIDVRRFLGENRRLREHHGVTGIGHREIDGRHPGLVLGPGRVRHHRGGGGRCVDLFVWKMLFKKLILRLNQTMYWIRFIPCPWHTNAMRT